MKRFFLFVSIVVVCMSGCGAARPSPERWANRPSLKKAMRAPTWGFQKYPVSLGVMTARDQRLMPFFRDEDAYFKEPITEGVSDILCARLKAGGLFAEVRRINERIPETFTEEEILRLKMDYGVDMLLFTDVIHFNMLRDKEASRIINAFKITADVGVFLELIYLDGMHVVWAEQLRRQSKALAADGALEPEGLGNLVGAACGNLADDMQILILRTGMNMVAEK